MGESRLGACAAVLFLLLVTGCGSAKHDNSIKGVLSSFDSALASGDGTKACDLLTDNRRSQVVQDSGRDCPETLGELSKPGSPLSQEVKSLSSAKIGTITVAGDTAFAEVTSGAFGTSVAQLEKQPGKGWRMSDSATGF